jgi:hypothetical protein
MLLITGFASVFVLILTALFLSAKNYLLIAASIAGSSWLVLGILAAWISEQPPPADQVVKLVDSSRMDLRQPLRWHGRLRDEPRRLPWGTGLEVELAGVEY